MNLYRGNSVDGVLISSISPEYVDVTEVFYSAPDRWLTSEYPTAAAAPLPTHLVMYDVLKPVSIFIASGIPCGMFTITIFASFNAAAGSRFHQ